MSIKRFDESCMEGGGVAPHANGEYVKYADHIASHAYDEAKERELFESRWGFTNEEQEIYFIPELNCYGSARVNDAANNKSSAWYWWQACAKSREGAAS